MCSAALTIPSSQAFSLLDVEVPIKVPEETVQVVQMCELLAFKPLVLYVNKEPSGQLSTMRFLVVKSARDARASSFGRVCKRSSETKSTGAVQVIARADRERERLPVSDSIIVRADSMIICLQRVMVADINHPQQL